ncbi:MAG: ergothioneine biosynthesis protein EgtB [Gammaproteobacteria bacterium]|nr:ergothioneine biosynthesis protein EgtB [Gammaproteobacteria bacterium]
MTQAAQRSDGSDVGEALVDFQLVRQRSRSLVAALEVEDFGVQPMADASPPKWHLAHTTWFFETFLLQPFLAGYQPLDARYTYLFNSYYNGVGAQFPRARRGQLSRPTVAEVMAYRDHVDAAMVALVERGCEDEVRRRLVLGTQHEEQHQELLITDLKYAFGHNPLQPAYGDAPVPAAAPASAALTYSELPGGLLEIGREPLAALERRLFSFDNETPRHRVWLEPYRLADRCVTNAEYLMFMADGGYGRPELWLADGWGWLQQPGAPRAPLYWFEQDGSWWSYTLGGPQPLDPEGPVCHLSGYEADAYARWAGARLPSEAEWEAAAAEAGGEGVFLDDGRFHPGSAAGGHLAAMRGDLWEWTSSAYAPYPGYRPLPGALGEYNGKFMANQLVLRGGSCATPRAHIRDSYRNFFYPPDRWQFTGVRLAQDA